VGHKRGSPKVPGSGRQKGTPNKITQSEREMVARIFAANDPVEEYKDIIRRFESAFEAREIKFFQKDGEVKETRDVVDWTARLNALQLKARLLTRLLEWHYGTPRQTIEHTGVDGGPIEHTIKFGDGQDPKN